MKVLAIDPSSTATGYAVMSDPRVLIDAGKLKPVRRSDEPNRRIVAMGVELDILIREHKPDVIVIEDTSGKVSNRHGRGGGAGLSIYGKAIGYLMRVVEMHQPPLMILENVWTRGIAKVSRQKYVAMQFKGYDVAKDGGGDVADAIALCRWYLIEGHHRRLLEG